MSDNVDTRVVELDFQNKNFEKSAQESIRTLGNLERALKLDGSTEGLERVEKTARDMDLSVLERSVEKVSDKFSALGIMGVTAIQNITNKAIDAGERLIKSLTFDQIGSGWLRMDELTTATQTLRANGYEMERIEKELDKLMFFSDETSYSFNDMTSNLVKFTSQGLELEKSATALRGVAAWAAAAGQNSQTASRAMYNISQALGTGAMKLTDWKSIELFNMGTAEFKKLTLEAAAAVGKLTEKNGKYYLQTEKGTKETEVTIANFRDTLKDGWFDTEVMMKVFGRYGAYADLVQQVSDLFDLDSANDAMDFIDTLAKTKPELRAQMLVTEDYAKSLEEANNILSNLDLSAAYDEVSRKAYLAGQEAKTFNEAVGAVREAVSSGWMTTFKLIFGNYEQQKTLWTDAANRLWDIFAEGGKKRNNLLKDWAKTGTKTVSEMILNLLDIVYNFKTLVSEAFTAVFGEITAKDLISFTNRVAGAIQSLKDFSEDAEKTAKIRSVLQGFARALKIVADVGGAVIKFAGDFIRAFGGTFLEIALDIVDFLFAPNSLAEGSKNSLVWALDFTSRTLVSFADKVRSVWRDVRDFLRYLLDPSAAFSDSEKAGQQNDIEGYQRIKSIYGTVEKIRPLWEAISTSLKATFDKIQYVWDVLRYVIDPKGGENEHRTAFKAKNKSLVARIVAARKTAMNIRSTLQTLWSDLSSAFNTAKDFVVGVLSTFGIDVSNAWENVTSWLSRFFAGGEETEKAVSDLSDKIKGTWESIKQKIVDFASGFGIDIPSIAEAVSGFFKSLFGANDKPKSISELVKEKGGILIASAGMSDAGGMLQKADSAFEKGKKFGEKVKSVFEKISTFITNTWTAVSGFVSKAWNKVKPYIENAIVVVRFLFNPSLPDLSKVDDDAMVKRITGLHAIATRIRDVFTKLVSAVTDIIQSIKTFIKEQDILGKAGRLRDTFVKLFYDVTDFVKGFFSAFDIDLSEVWNKLLSGDFSGAIQKILDGLNNVSKWVSGKISGLFVATEGTDPKKTPLALAIAWVQNAANTIFNAIKNAKLSNIFTGIVSYLKNTIVPLLLLISGGMFMFGVGKALANSKKGPGIGEIMQQIAGAMLVLSASFAILGAVDEKTIETGKNLLFKFINVVVGIKLLFFAINTLNKIFLKDKNGIDTVTGIGNEMLQIAGALAIVALSIAGLSLLFKNNLLDLTTIGYGTAFIAGAGVLILGLVLALTAIQKKIKSKNESDSFDGLGDTVLKLAGAIGIFAVLAVAIGALAGITPGVLISGGIIVTLMGGALVALLAAIAVVQTRIAKGDDISKFGNLMLKLAGALAIMAIVAVTLGTMSDVAWSGIGHIFVMLLVVVAALASLSWALSKFKLDKSVIWNLAAYVVALIPVFAGFLLIPKDIRVEQIVAVLGGMVVAVGALIGVSWALSKFKTNWGDWASSALPSLLSLIVVMIAVVAALNFLPKDINMDSVWAFAAAMGIAVLAFVAIGGAFALFGVLKGPIEAGIAPLLKIVAVIGLVVAIFGAVALILGTMDTIFDGSVTTAIDKGVEILISITQGLGRAVAAIISGIGLQLTQDAVTMAQNVGLVMAELKNMLTSMKGVKAPKNLWKNMESVIDIINKMSKANISDRFNSGVSGRNSTEFFKQGLKDIGEGLANFVNAVSGISVDQISNAEGLTEVADSVADIVAKLSEITIYGSEDDFYGKTMTLTELSGQLEAFGKALNAYVASVNGLNENGKIINADQIDIADRVTGIGGKLADIALAVSKIEGYSHSLDGKDTALVKFSGDIVILGNALKEYVRAVNGFDVNVNEGKESVTGTQFNEQQVGIAEKVTEIGRRLADIANAVSKIEEYDGENQFDKANSTIAKFSGDIVILGNALKEYVRAVNGFDVNVNEGKESVTGTQFNEQQVGIAEKVTEIGRRLADIANAVSKIEEYDGENQFDKANSTIAKFSGDIVILGNALKEYVRAVNGFDVNVNEGKKSVTGKQITEQQVGIAEKVTEIGRRLADIANAVSKIEEYDGENQFDKANSTIAKFSGDIVILGNALKEYVRAVNGFDVNVNEGKKSVTGKQITEQQVGIAEKVTEIGRRLADIADAVSKIEEYDGENQFDKANSTIAKFSGDIVILGNALKEYVRAVNGFDVNVNEGKKSVTGKQITEQQVGIAEKVTEIGRRLADIADAVSKIEEYDGENQFDKANSAIAKFSSDITTLGGALKAYVLLVNGFALDEETGKVLDESVKEIDTKDTLIAAQVTQIGVKLSDIAAKVSSIDTDEKGNKRLGGSKSSLKGFASELGGLGTAFHDYVKKVLGFGVSDTEMATLTSDQVDIAAQVGTVIDKVADIETQVAKIDNTQSPIRKLLGFHNDSLKGFGDQLPGFGESLSNYVKAIGAAVNFADADGNKIELDKIEQMSNIAVSFADFIGKLPPEGLLDRVFGGQWEDLTGPDKKNFEDFAIVLAKAVSAFSSNLTSFADPKNVENAKIASDIVSMFASAISIMNGAENPIFTLTHFMESLPGISFEMFDAENAKIAAEFVRGIGSIAQAATDIADEQELGKRMADVGKDILLGLLEGLSDKDIVDKLIAQMQYIADSLEFTVRVATKTESPSRLFEQIGGFLIDGLALGIRNNADKPAKEMGKAIDGVKHKSVSEFVKEKGGILIASAGMSDVGGLLSGVPDQMGDALKDATQPIVGAVENLDATLGTNGVITNVVSGLLDSGVEKVTATGKKLTSGLSTAIGFLTGGSDSLVDSIAGIFGSSGELSLDKLMEKLKGVLPEGISKYISDDDWKNLVDAVSGSDSALDKNFISGWFKGVLDKLIGIENAPKDASQGSVASKKKSSDGITGEFKHTGPHKWSTTPTKEWQLRYATYAEQKKHNYTRPGIYADPPQVVRTYRADGTLVGTAVEDRRGYTYHQRKDGTVYATDKMGNSLVPVQDAADKANAAFEHLNETLSGTASVSAEAASRAAEQAKNGNQNAVGNDMSDSIEKLNKNVINGFDAATRDLGDKISDLGQSMSNLKVVLDDGTLVGQILPQIDYGLGVRATRKGNMHHVAVPL